MKSFIFTVLLMTLVVTTCLGARSSSSLQGKKPFSTKNVKSFGERLVNTPQDALDCLSLAPRFCIPGCSGVGFNSAYNCEMNFGFRILRCSCGSVGINNNPAQVTNSNPICFSDVSFNSCSVQCRLVGFPNTSGCRFTSTFGVALICRCDMYGSSQTSTNPTTAPTTTATTAPVTAAPVTTTTTTTTNAAATTTTPFQTIPSLQPWHVVLKSQTDTKPIANGILLTPRVAAFQLSQLPASTFATVNNQNQNPPFNPTYSIVQSFSNLQSFDGATSVLLDATQNQLNAANAILRPLDIILVLAVGDVVNLANFPCIPSIGDDIFAQINATAFGFGVNGLSSAEMAKYRVATGLVLTSAECKRLTDFPATAAALTNFKICMTTNDTVSCSMANGVPLVAQFNGKPAWIGLGSFRTKSDTTCPVLPNLGVFTRINDPTVRNALVGSNGIVAC